MNRIYKVIFNKAKGCYEVVGEFAHSQGKVKSKRIISTIKKEIQVMATIAMVFSISPNVFASYYNTSTVTISDVERGVSRVLCKSIQ